MSEKFYASANGAFLGVYVDGATPPNGAVEVANPPSSAAMIWDGQQWTAPPPSLQEQFSEVWAIFGRKADALANRMLRARMFDGPNLATAEATIQAEYAAIIVERDAALAAIDPE